MSETCKLCLQKELLNDSHILPRSYLKTLKRGSSQLIHMRIAGEKKPVKSNFNPKERLLCNKCEQLIDVNYEKYGTRYLHAKYFKTERLGTLILRNYKFQKLYLYLASILWRASISTLELFQPAQIQPIEEMLRYCILNNTLNYAHAQITDVLRIRIIRIITKNFDQTVFDNLFINFYTQSKPTHYEINLVMHGFLISFMALGSAESHLYIDMIGHISNTNFLRIPKRDYQDYPQILEGLKSLILKSSQYPELGKPSKFP